jgi:ATP-dependent Lhr-like helicase
MREAHRRVSDKLRGDPQPTRGGGRWSLVHRPGVLGPGMSDEERAGQLARVYLERYGVLMRECLEREDSAAEWSQLYPVLQRMEMRGEVRRGYFVAGLSGLQFALPEAVEKLRASADSSDDAVIVVNATDPLNLYGGEWADGPMAAGGEALRFARLASTHCMLWRGQPVLVAEDGGERFTGLRGVEPVVMKRALQAYLTRSHLSRHVLVTHWDGRPVHGSEGGRLLLELGFYRVPSGLEWWSSV